MPSPLEKKQITLLCMALCLCQLTESRGYVEDVSLCMCESGASSPLYTKVHYNTRST
jgi:hypothetical protein